MSDMEERIAVQDVMLRYAAGVDDRDLELYRSCFADDVLIVGFDKEDHVGGDNWTAIVKEKLKPFGATQHMLAPQLATINGNKASARTDVQALHYMADKPDTTLTLWATYKTELEKIDGEWKITRHELVPRGTRVQSD
ncbi:MAG: nuclear transport factor 2 family protein [Pseudomonadota bacterium]